MDTIATRTATFTKWMVGEGPEMKGTVGGAVGEGAYEGKVLDMVMGDTTVVAAEYGFKGSAHDFKALVHVEQTGLHARDHGRRHRRLEQGESGPRLVRRGPVLS